MTKLRHEGTFGSALFTTVMNMSRVLPSNYSTPNIVYAASDFSAFTRSKWFPTCRKSAARFSISNLAISAITAALSLCCRMSSISFSRFAACASWIASKLRRLDSDELVRYSSGKESCVSSVKRLLSMAGPSFLCGESSIVRILK